jgi:hypothetical protein
MNEFEVCPVQVHNSNRFQSGLTHDSRIIWKC